MAARRRDRPPGAALAEFKEKTAYGPMFGCCCCSTTHFREEVVEVGRVAVLASEEGRERYLDLPFLRTNPHLYTQLDTAWLCLSCQAWWARPPPARPSSCPWPASPACRATRP